MLTGKFAIDDRVMVKSGPLKGLEGTVTGYWYDTDADNYGEVEVHMDTNRYQYFGEEDDLERIDQYEFALQITYDKVGRHIKEEEWTTREDADEKLKLKGEEGHDPWWGPWTAKVVKRRKAGRIEDV